MAIELSFGQRYDSRGLPEGYDPHKLYEYRYDTFVKDGSAFESFLYKLMPFSLVKSFAFALDPTAEFKVSTMPITPVNRTRYRGTASVLDLRHYRGTRYIQAQSHSPNYGNVQICWSPGLVTTTDVTVVTGDYYLNGQQVLHDSIKDTTRRTRLFGSDHGLLEMFKGYLSSPPRTVRYGLTSVSVHFANQFSNEPQCGMVGGGPNKSERSVDLFTNTLSRAARLPEHIYSSFRNGEIEFCKALCQKNAISMLKGITPFNRDYTLARNLVELRDIPRSIVQLQQTALDLRKVFVSLARSPKTRKVIFNLKGLARDVPNEYLSYHFGWKQLYKDISDLLTLPEKQSKKISFLIRRSGKATTLRSKRDILSGTAGVSGFEYDPMAGESDFGYYSRIERSSQVRLVVNCIWEFPPINSVAFNQHVYTERTGISPRITDVYNLVPWTWLIDWFTGLGNYVELIDIINHDPKLVNWGLISCRTNGRLITDMSSKSSLSSASGTGGPLVYDTTVVNNRHTSFYDYECQTRSDVATILDVKLTSVPSSLTAYQMSILGALIAQRTKFRR